MKRSLRVIAILFLLLLLGVAACYVYITNMDRSNILSNGPRQPNLELPVTYNIGWWPAQNTLCIDSFAVHVVDSRLSMFNSQSLIAYRVAGHFKRGGQQNYRLKEVHLSERINADTSLHCDRIIEITPVVEDTKDKNDDIFTFKNEHIINSNHWGHNRIKLICGPYERMIVLRQSK